jgi:hypothetical protein
MTSYDVVRTATIVLVLSSCEVAAVSERVPAGQNAMSIRIQTRPNNDESLNVVIVSESASSTAAIPSLKVRHVTTGEEFWSPFDARGRPLGLNGRVPIRRGVTEITLRLSAVKWARSRSALWPSRRFRDVIPPGKYEVVARLSPVGGRLIESNRVSLAVDDRE